MILNPPTCTMTELNNLFIELTAKNCNQRCKHCYIDFPISKNVKDFLPVESVKKALSDTKKENIQCIYLTGAEPMTHPEFNVILRMCLKYSNVCIQTNGSFINEKKSRFLKKVEDEGNNEIIFNLSIDHYDEIKNDEVRCRGAYRTTLNAIKSLVKYGFNPILTVTNYYNEPNDVLISELKKICKKFNFDANTNNFVINKYIDSKNKNIELNDNINTVALDCKNSRTLTNKGVYSCPFLANDHRGRCGTDFSDFSKHNPIETEYCAACLKNSNQYFCINFELFK